MDAESGPIRCDSTLSVVKIQPVNDGTKDKRLLTRHKFGDPEIEELYQLHSANQKRTELFRCFLYCILFYSLVHICIYGAWIGKHPVVFGGEEEDGYHRHGYHSLDSHGVPTTTAEFDVETPETMTLNTYATMLETSHSRLLKSVFHVDETSDILQYSVVKNHEHQANQYPAGKKVMSLETGSRLALGKSSSSSSGGAAVQGTGTPPSSRSKSRPPPPPHNYHYTNTNNDYIKEHKNKGSSASSSTMSMSSGSSSSTTENIKRKGSNTHLLSPPSILGINSIEKKNMRSETNIIDVDDYNHNDDKKIEISDQKQQQFNSASPIMSSPLATTHEQQHYHHRLLSNELVDKTSETGSNNMIRKSKARSLTWFPYSSTKTNYHFLRRMKRASTGTSSIVTRGAHRHNNINNSNNNDNKNKNNLRGNEHKLEAGSGSGFQTTSSFTTGNSEQRGRRSSESGGSIGTGVNFPSAPISFTAAAYSQDDSEFYSHSELGRGNLYFVCTLCCLLIACVFTVSFMLLPFKRCPRNHHIPVIIWSATILCSVACNVESSVHPRLALGWILLETFLIWITLPLRMRTALFYTSLLAVLYVIVTSIRESNRPYLGRQIGADIILIVITNLMGVLEFYLSDKKQRRAFIDTRQSLEMKLVIEEQANEQERLLLSVLPEHLALKMRQDLGAAGDGQFKKIYMSRHENVSILYADIVGFTAISSTYSASELVKILNELFATFDKLAEKYNQIRIKILGDCYYCICGAPEERADHAILCVHMGLSMVKAIKYVREKTKSSVDMRVGIHTGAILAGVLGQRQWQFDIYSKDVELANKMESSGKPGRVHISEVTMSFLDDGFEVEPAHGEKREEILRIAGIKTYFIVRPIKPFRESTTGATENGDLPPDDTIITKDLPSDLHSTFAEDSNSAIEESHVHGKQTELEAYRLRLKDELLSRDGYKDLSRQSHWLTLSFRDSSKESEFTKHTDPYAGIYYGACPIALVAVALSAFSVVSFTVVGLVVLLIGLLFLGLITIFYACETSPMKTRMRKLSGLSTLQSELWLRRLISVLGALILTLANFAFMVPCLEVKECSMRVTDDVEEPLVLPNLHGQPPGSHEDCRLPAFFIPFAAVILFGVTLLTYLGFWLKSLVIVVILLVHTILILATPLKQMMECSERIDNDEYRLIPVYCYLALFAVVAFAGLFSLNRRLEKSARVLFLWKTEVEQQRETATQLRQKNEALVYNILPPHVATHFLGSRRRKHEELYSQSYSEVGILFASMPNFSDFYTEETVNNQGLECLRFLNEVISDYDALLELPKFNEHIIKIKTIASTYMAASGLSPSKQAKPEDPAKTRWQHLSLLVEFAFELKKALTCINEQSFNHFVLKMGINHGPITAGVIGARKPHYDIWGNSVNVASRMESTGKAGCIQVTAETHRILRPYGYLFEQRGLVNVKGKGQLMTYYLVGRGPEPSDEEMQKMLSEPETDGNTTVTTQ